MPDQRWSGSDQLRSRLRFPESGGNAGRDRWNALFTEDQRVDRLPVQVDFLLARFAHDQATVW
jgi:hypothetical protein